MAEPNRKGHIRMFQDNLARLTKDGTRRLGKNLTILKSLVLLATIGKEKVKQKLDSRWLKGLEI